VVAVTEICENTTLEAGLVGMESRGELDLEWAWSAVGGGRSYLADNSTRTSMTIYFIPPYLPRARGRNLPPIIPRSRLRRNTRLALNINRRRICRLFGGERFDTVVMYVSTFLFVFLVLPSLPRGRLHPSQSDARWHWTIRLFRDGFASCTLHVYPYRRRARFFPNGGRWERGGCQLDIGSRCRVL
jgi:hypothetical protein